MLGASSWRYDFCFRQKKEIGKFLEYFVFNSSLTKFAKFLEFFSKFLTSNGKKKKKKKKNKLKIKKNI